MEYPVIKIREVSEKELVSGSPLISFRVNDCKLSNLEGFTVRRNNNLEWPSVVVHAVILALWEAEVGGLIELRRQMLW